MPKSIEENRVLLGEGEDEVNFFEAYLKHIGILDLQVIEVGGKNRFKDGFELFLKDTNFNSVESYAIIRDADDSAESTYQSIADLLRKYKQPVPSGHSEFASDDKCKVGVFIIPGNGEKGMLEDLCLRTVKDHPIMECVDIYFSCLEKKTEENIPGETKDPKTPYFPKNIAKAKSHAFLSGMHEYKPSIGIAAAKGYWDLDSEELSSMKAFLENLIGKT